MGFVHVALSFEILHSFNIETPSFKFRFPILLVLVPFLSHLWPYRVTLVVAYMGWVDLDFKVPLSAGFCLGRWEFGRTGYTSGKDNGTSKSKSTQPR